MTRNRQAPPCGHDFPGNEGRAFCFWCGRSTAKDVVPFQREAALSTARQLEMAATRTENGDQPLNEEMVRTTQRQAAGLLRQAVHDIGNYEMIVSNLAVVKTLLANQQEEIAMLRRDLGRFR